MAIAPQYTCCATRDGAARRPSSCSSRADGIECRFGACVERCGRVGSERVGPSYACDVNCNPAQPQRASHLVLQPGCSTTGHTGAGGARAMRRRRPHGQLWLRESQRESHRARQRVEVEAHALSLGERRESAHRQRESSSPTEGEQLTAHPHQREGGSSPTEREGSSPLTLTPQRGRVAHR